jgi:hypothetical protein
MMLASYDNCLETGVRVSDLHDRFRQFPRPYRFK